MIKTLWKQRRSKSDDLEAACAELQEVCGLTPLTSKLLASRGYDTADAAMAFLEPDIADLYDPFMLPDMDKAVTRLLEARDNGETVCVYGDYDADGTTGVSILMMYFEQIGLKAFYRIPNRLKEGYGLNKPAIEQIAKQGAALILTVDNGIASHDEALFCQEQGMDIIITDHHECQGDIPNALAVIDAKRPDSGYPFSELCGAGVALKLVQALDNTLGLHTDLEPFIECAAIATVADIVPLKSENRIITALGIASLNASPLNRGLRALIEVSELKRVTAGNIGFIIGPKINAAGRLGDANKVVELYLSPDDTVAADIAGFLSEENRKRQEIEQMILEEAIQQVEEKKLDKSGIIVVAGKGWHSGVIGIVASRIQEKWHHPVIAIGIEDDGAARGSCRSVDGFNIFDAVCSCKDLFTTFGGHEQAAGFSMVERDIEALNERINVYAAAHNIEDCLIRRIYYDSEMQLSDVSETLIEELNQLEPFGVGNPGPVFRMDNLLMENARKMGSDKTHLMFTAAPFRCVGFGMAHILDNGDGGQFSILCKPEINCFRDKKSVQLLLKDIKRSPFSDNRSAWMLINTVKGADLFALPELGLSKKDYSRLPLSREKLVLIYRLVCQIAGRWTSVDSLLEKHTAINNFEFLAGLNVLQEACLILFQIRKGQVACKILQTNEKKDIQNTPLMLKLNKYAQEFAEK